MRYFTFSDLLSRYFHCKVQKITVDAGFGCPNRDGTKGVGGCTYCADDTFSPPTLTVEDGIRFFSGKYPDMKYLVYFQARTNTYAPLDALRSKYEEALSHPAVAGLVIGTRPDCLPADVLDYLSDIARRSFLLVEFGIESTSDVTLRRINRRHTWEEAQEAVRRTAEQGILTGAHLILGLPGESSTDFLLHAQRLAALPLTTLKLHQLQLIRHTPMAGEYLARPDDFPLFTVDQYIDLVIDFIERIPQHVAFDRFVAQSPPHRLLLPGWGLKNYQFSALLQRRLDARDAFQGALLLKNTRKQVAVTS
ncbi:MAG: TIGR01212 family radical SAM protein [Tannerellaceae bacterium]|nr:TIGR01212 family radical SAM protein [Tannerellaceae bacterium]